MHLEALVAADVHELAELALPLVRALRLRVVGVDAVVVGLRCLLHQIPCTRRSGARLVFSAALRAAPKLQNFCAGRRACATRSRRTTACNCPRALCRSPMPSPQRGGARRLSRAFCRPSDSHLHLGRRRHRQAVGLQLIAATRRLPPARQRTAPACQPALAAPRSAAKLPCSSLFFSLPQRAAKIAPRWAPPRTRSPTSRRARRGRSRSSCSASSGCGRRSTGSARARRRSTSAVLPPTRCATASTAEPLLYGRDAAGALAAVGGWSLRAPPRVCVSAGLVGRPRRRSQRRRRRALKEIVNFYLTSNLCAPTPQCSTPNLSRRRARRRCPRTPPPQSPRAAGVGERSAG